jgi:osmoprotectant transport system ATP-binding protein
MPVTELRRRIGYVIQQTGLFPHQTIAENVGTVPRLLGWDRERIRRRVDDLIALVGLNPDKVRSRYPAQLSGGERQRIGVARALAAEPPLMLMDEPFGAVDPIVRSRLQDEFLTFQRHLGVTVLFVTHDIDEAIKLGDRVAVMQEGGRVAQYAAPEDLLAHPADEFVARFVGADRGLKRLSLMRVGDQPLSEAVVAHQGDTADAIRGKYGPDTPWALLLDRDGRPEGWVNLAKLPRDRGIEASDADPTSPILHALTPVRDAFSAMLASAVQTGVVVDDRGLFIGALELETVTELLRRPAVEAL